MWISFGRPCFGKSPANGAHRGSLITKFIGIQIFKLSGQRAVIPSGLGQAFADA
jgi:hypothetical protein